MYLASGVLDSRLCRSVRLAMDAGVVDAADVLDGTFARRDEVRRVSSIEPDPATLRGVEAWIDAQRAALAAFYGWTLGEREGPGFLRYGAGCFYRPHRDRALSPAWPDAARRQITVVLFLNGSREAEEDGEFSGGALRIAAPEGPVEIVPRTGLLVAFPADLLHEVTPVRGGTRDTVVDWFYFARDSAAWRERSGRRKR